MVYTGDLRLHGSQGDRTRHFIAEARALKPRVLLCEGTRTPRRGAETEPEPPTVTEAEVEANAERVVRGEQGLVVADFGPRNVERLQVFLNVARATDRYLVILAKDAYLLDAMHLIDKSIPTPETEPRLRVYDDLKSSPGLWERLVRERHKDALVRPEDIHAHQDRFILCFSFWDVKNLIDIAPRGGTYVYSSSEAYTEEQQLDIWRLRNWLQHFELRGVGLPKVSGPGGEDMPQFEEGEATLHASGHASASDLVALAKEIAPRTLIPIHTENPGFFLDALRNEPIEVREPVYGEPIELS